MSDTVTDPHYLRREADHARAAVTAAEEKVTRARRDLDGAKTDLQDARTAAVRLDQFAAQAEKNQPRVDGDSNGSSVDAHADTATANTED